MSIYALNMFKNNLSPFNLGDFSYQIMILEQECEVYSVIVSAVAAEKNVTL